MTKKAITQEGEEHEVPDLYTHTRGGVNVEYLSTRHQIKVEANVVLTPEQVADVLVNMSTENFARTFHHLYVRTQQWGHENRTHIWQQVREYLDEENRCMMHPFLAELTRWTAPD